MEKFSKTALTLFFPFRDAATDLTVDGKHLPKFQMVFASGALDNHKHHFANAQESHDSFNCGRPKDVLESITNQPTCTSQSNTNDSDVLLMEMDENFVDNMNIIVPSNSICFHDNANKLVVCSSMIIDSGSHNCGRHLLNAPIVPPLSAISTQESVNTTTSTDPLTADITTTCLLKPNTLPRKFLHTLLTKKHNVVNTNDGNINWEEFTFTGSLANISHCANLCFNGDKDQELAFAQIVSAFVLKLHEKSKVCTEPSTEESIIQMNILRATLNNPDQFICFLSGQG